MMGATINALILANHHHYHSSLNLSARLGVSLQDFKTQALPEKVCWYLAHMYRRSETKSEENV